LPRNKNFRSGDLTEGYVLERFRSDCFVAPVPREEDEGIDAYLTLHSDDLIPLETFALQVKSHSVKSVELNRDSITYLVEQGIPYFIARGDRVKQRIEVFCADPILLWYALFNKKEPIVLWLGGKLSKEGHLEPGPRTNLKKIKGTETLVYELGSPILALGNNPTVSVKKIMEKWIEFCKFNRTSFHMGQIQIRHYWETNALSTNFRAVHISYGNFRDLDINKLHRTSHVVKWLWTLTLEHPTLIPALSLLTEWMRLQGIDPDPHGLMQFRALKASTALNPNTTELPTD
jgi:hypothetical protein